jgi:hypothetical protein
MYTSQSYLGVAVLLCLGAWTACSPGVAPDAGPHRMGEHVGVGALTYNVFEDKWRTQVGEGTDARVPKDRFFLLRLSVVNGGSTDLMVPALTLVDDAGQTYAELPNGEGVPEWTGYLRRVKPAETLQGNIVFDVSPKHYRLRVTDETGQKSRDIDIPLNFASDTSPLLLGLLALAGSLLAATVPLAVVRPTVSDRDGGAAEPSGSVHVPGETMFFSFQVDGFTATSVERVHLSYKLDALDPHGVHLMEPVAAEIEETLAPEDKNWKPTPGGFRHLQDRHYRYRPGRQGHGHQRGPL